MAARPEHPPRTALCSLLCKLFSEDELKRFVANGRYAPLEHQIHWAAPRQQLVEDFIDACARRGLLNDEFFEQLADHRPQRRDDITTVAAQWRDRPKFPVNAPRGSRRLLLLLLSVMAILSLLPIALRPEDPPASVNVPPMHPTPETAEE